MSSKLRFLVVITNKSSKKHITKLIESHNGKVVHVIFGRGAISSIDLKELFGINKQESKIVLMSLIETENANKIIDALITNHGFNKPNTGIAFTVPVSNIF